MGIWAAQIPPPDGTPMAMCGAYSPSDGDVWRTNPHAGWDADEDVCATYPRLAGGGRGNLPGSGQESWQKLLAQGKHCGVAGDVFSQDLARYLAATTGLPQSTARRVIDDVNAYYDETVEEFVRRRHTELRRDGHKNDEIWPLIAAELTQRRFAASDLSARQLRRIIYG